LQNSHDALPRYFVALGRSLERVDRNPAL